MSDITGANVELRDRPLGMEPPRGATSPVSSESGGVAEVDLRDFIFMLWRRKALIVFIIAAFLLLGWLGLSFVKPRYTAEAMVMIENARETKSAELGQLVGSLNLDNTIILSEVEVLRSRSLARQVIQKHNLITDPELNPLLTLQAPRQDMKYDPKGGAGKDVEPYAQTMTMIDMPPEVTNRVMGRIVNNFLKKVKVYPVTGSNVIKVEYTSSDAETSARITNALIDSYLERRLEENIAAPQKYNEWLEGRLKTLSEQVRVSEEAVERYRNEKNLIVGSRAEVTAQRISELNSQLVNAKAKHAEALARLSQVQGARKATSDKQSAAEVLRSGLVTQLKVRESDLQRTLSELSERYGHKHPAIQNVKSEIEKIRDKIDLEIENVLSSIENEVEVAEARVNALEEDLDGIEGTRSKENRDMIRLRELVREAETNRLIFEKFLETNKRADEQEKLEEPEAEIISYAIPPDVPSYPNKPLFLSLIATMALFLAIGICLLLEKFDNAFRSAGQLENSTGRACFALVPIVERVPQAELADYVISKPSSSLAEAVRTLRTVLKLRAGSSENRPKVISITSSFPGEGKSTLSSWLARVAAKSGEKVIVIDGDLRRPTIHKMLTGRGDKTIVEYLTGQAKLDEVIEKDPATGLHKIYARSVPNSALDLIDSARMKNLVDSLRKVYDLVIIDTPACLAVSDARVLASLADQTLYCVYWDKTAREIVATGVKQFTDIGYNDVAFVLTNVDVSKHARYGYGDTPYYYAKYKEYYRE